MGEGHFLSGGCEGCEGQVCYFLQVAQVCPAWRDMYWAAYDGSNLYREAAEESSSDEEEEAEKPEE